MTADRSPVALRTERHDMRHRGVVADALSHRSVKHGACLMHHVCLHGVAVSLRHIKNDFC